MNFARIIFFHLFYLNINFKCINYSMLTKRLTNKIKKYPSQDSNPGQWYGMTTFYELNHSADTQSATPHSYFWQSCN